MKEKSLVMLKPDAVLRRLAGKIINRFEERGLQILAAKMMIIPREQAQEHYAEHKEKPFFGDLVDYITSGPVLAMVIEGEESISLIRKMVGATNPKKSELGTIRGDYAIDTGRNIIHASDSPASAQREIALFFQDDEICQYQLPDMELIYEEP
jgi:nucleoside-diphosphate kinase